MESVSGSNSTQPSLTVSRYGEIQFSFIQSGDSMGQFKNIDIALRQIADDTNVHPSIRDAMRNTSVKQAPVDKVYLLLCDGNVTDVFTDKDMAMYDLYTCIKADEAEGLDHEWKVIVRQLTTTTLP